MTEIADVIFKIGVGIILELFAIVIMLVIIAGRKP